MYQQDGHPAHTSVLARANLNRRFTHRWIGIHSDLQEWLSPLPDLTHAFFVWVYIRDQVYQTLLYNRGDLIEKIKEQVAI